MKNKKIGWIGLGNMGIPMVANLINAGFDVSVYNRTESKTKPLCEMGAKKFDSEEELCMHSDVIFTMLPDDDSVDEVYKTLLAKNASGKLFINMSTISPKLAEQLYHKCKEQKAEYLDAPVSGSVKPATDGTLIILVGGEKNSYDSALPYFEKLGKLSLLLGESGAGTKAKLAINYYMAVVIDGLAETILFAEKQGVARDTMMQIINASACGSPMSAMKTSAILNDKYPPAFPLKYMLKDVKLAINEGCQTYLSEAMLKVYQNASEKGFANDDLMAVIKGYE